MKTGTSEETPAVEENAEQSSEGNEESTGEASKAPEISEVDRLALDGESESTSDELKSKESTVDADKKSEATEDISKEETPAASKEDKKSKEDDRAAGISAERSGDAFGATDPALLVEAGNAGISPQLASQLAQAGPEVLRSTIAEWSKTAAAHESAESQKKTEIPKIEIDREEYGDAIADAFETLSGQMTALTEQNTAMATELSGMKAGNTRDVSMKAEAEFDRQVEALGEDWGELFGTGSSASMKGTPEYRNREEVFDKMQLEDAVRDQLNKSSLTREESFKRALYGIHHEYANKLTTQAISKSVTKRSSQSIQKPAHGGAKSLDKGRELAIATAAKKQKEYGTD